MPARRPAIRWRGKAWPGGRRSRRTSTGRTEKANAERSVTGETPREHVEVALPKQDILADTDACMPPQLASSAGSATGMSAVQAMVLSARVEFCEVWECEALALQSFTTPIPLQPSAGRAGEGEHRWVVESSHQDFRQVAVPTRLSAVPLNPGRKCGNDSVMRRRWTRAFRSATHRGVRDPVEPCMDKGHT